MFETCNFRKIEFIFVRVIAAKLQEYSPLSSEIISVLNLILLDLLKVCQILEFELGNN